MDNRPATPPFAPAQVLHAALDLGEQILLSGGEVSRVEDTIARICRAYGADRTDVFTITSNIIVTARFPGCGSLTLTRRVRSLHNDLTALTALNALSRRACAELLPPETLEAELLRIKALPQYGFWASLGIWCLISACFALFFGGNPVDAVFSALVGALLKFLFTALERLRINSYFSVILCSVLGGLLSTLPGLMGFEANSAAISIGNIMLMIPGVALTNAIRDMFSGDTISGIMRCVESIGLSLAIAWGFALSAADANAAGASSTVVYLTTAFVGSMAFGLLFNLRGINLVLGALGGTMAWGIVLAGPAAGLKELSAYLTAAICVTVYTEILARIRRCPVTVFLVMGIITLVPGGSLYRTMRYAISEDWDAFAMQGLQTLLYAIAISGGIVCITAIADALKLLPPLKRST